MLALIVGPSGVGKDTLLSHARRELGPDPLFCFPTRVITRPPEAGGEQNVAMSTSDFLAAEAAGRFFLSWRAHDLAYAIPGTVADDLRQGRVAAVNVSRSVIGAAEARAARVVVAHIKASRETLAGRLAQRGREAGEAARWRLDRIAMPTVGAQTRIVEISNEGEPAEAAAELIEFLIEAAKGPRSDSVR